jgi:hypothetical protein
METEEKKHKIYSIAKYIVETVMENKIVYHNFDELERKLAKAKLDDCEALMRIMKREIDNHNTELRASITRLKKVSYSNNWVDNIFFKRYKNTFSVPKISKCIEENPDMDYFDIYHKYFKV